MSQILNAIARTILQRPPRRVAPAPRRHVLAGVRLDAAWEACRNFQAQAFDLASIARFDGRFHALVGSAETLLEQADAQMLALPAADAARHFAVAAGLHREQACLAAMLPGTRRA